MRTGNLAKINVEKLDSHLQQTFKELAIALIEKYNDEVLSIVVFGSATTGDWIRGKSDIDFIIVISSKGNRKEVENFTNSHLIKLSTKYDLRLTQTCSAFRKTRNPFLKAISAIESFMTFGKPFFVLSKDQIEIDRGEIRDPRIGLVTSIFDSIAIFATKMKQTGSTIYGEEIIQKLHVKRSTTEKMKALLAPLWLTLMSIIVFPVDESLALDHSIKATLWACEDALFYLDQNLSSIKNEILLLENILSNRRPTSFDHVQLALRSRMRLRAGMKTEKGFAARFLLQTPLFILTLYNHIIASARITSAPKLDGS